MRQVEGDVGSSDAADPGGHGEGADGRVPDVGRVDLGRVHVDHREAARGEELADEGEGGPDGALLQEPGHYTARASEEQAPWTGEVAVKCSLHGEERFAAPDVNDQEAEGVARDLDGDTNSAFLSYLGQGPEDEADEDVSAKLGHGEAEAEVSQSHNWPQEDHRSSYQPYIRRKQIGKAELINLFFSFSFFSDDMPAEIHRLAVHSGRLGHECPCLVLPPLAQQPARGLGQQQPHGDLG